MELLELLEHYRDDSRVAHLIESFEYSGKTALLNVIGSQAAVFGAGIFLKADYSGLFVLANAEAAAYFENDLQQLLPNHEILLFPSSYKKVNNFTEIDNNRVLLRAKVIDELMHIKKGQKLIVTYPEAIQEMTVAAETIQENTLHLHLREKVDIDFMLDVLLEYGFERTDFVYEPGEFSIRGGIIDIFSFGNEYPYRIELFDDEVESMRTFHPETQLSVRKISELTIIPNINSQFKKERHTSLFEFLPNKSFIWIQSPNDANLLWNQHYESAQLEYERIQLVDVHSNHPFIGKEMQQLFLETTTLLSEIDRFPNIITGVYKAPEVYMEIDLKGKPQPSFNRNFELLIALMKEHVKEEITTYILSENPKQLERLRNIFEDIKANVHWKGSTISLSEGFVDHYHNIACFTDHQIFERFHKYKTQQKFSRDQAITVKVLKDLNPGDYVTHIDHGVGVFSGLQRLEINGKVQEAVRIMYSGSDILYVNINSLHKISKYAGKEGKVPKIHKLGSDVWNNLKNKTKKKVKDIARDLILLYAKRKMEKGFPFSKDTYLQNELEASFIYEDTPDQVKATADVKADMEKPHPMDRLICGDVGFGKTEIAVRAAFKAVTDGKQVAILVPTTILAWQHYKTFASRLEEFPVKVDFINRFKSSADKKKTLLELQEGKVDIIIGTHALLSKDVKFKDLGLLIIDEEQKFGVTAKEKLKVMASEIDTLTLSATPIPRTLKFSMMGARDLSNILTAPPNRQPVTTEVHEFDIKVIKEAIENEVFRGGQVFFVHNKVKDITDICYQIKQLVPGVEVNYAHGQMEGNQLENIMMDFINGKFDVLVSTNIIESGLDIPNANTIIINNAHHIGLSDLHQMRGRVGRSNKKAYCYLISPPNSMLSDDSRRRLQTLEEFSDLGSGFQIAMRDMDIRGAGNLLGSEQSGFIADIGFDMYHKILDEAIQELKFTDFKDLFQEQIDKQTEFVRDCTIETDCEMLIPHNYVTNTEERLKLYTELDEITNEVDLQEYAARLEDRFGKLPKTVEELFDGLRIRWKAKKAGFEKIILKNGKLRCYFLENPHSPFYETLAFQHIMSNIQKNKRAILKQSGESLILIFESVWTMRQAQKLLELVIQSEEVFVDEKIS
ncbi:MAG TPA: transcription-repair coupling factor [Chitinophagales bacterium]|nr:transcription-repair coupling factor [Chitinophagales bacterium]